MAQSVARQWPGLPEATPESLQLWAKQITRLLQEGAIASPGGSLAVDELTTEVLITDTIELGHPTDTTLSRLSAGDMAVEGNRVFRVGGADVPVADGGTGASTAAGARTNLGAVNIAGDTMTGLLTVDRNVSGNSSHFQALSTDAGADFGPQFKASRSSASPAANDLIGRFSFQGRDSGGNDTVYAYIQARIDDPTDGSEDASLLAGLLVGGVEVTTNLLNPEYIGTVTASNSAQVDFDLPAGYVGYQIRIRNLRSVTDNVFFAAQVSQNSGSSYLSGASDYNWHAFTNSATNDAADTLIRLHNDGAANGISNVANEASFFMVHLDNMLASGYYKSICSVHSIFPAGAAVFSGESAAVFQGNANAIDNIRFFMETGNINTGTFDLYGVRA